jgi:hypothetical protein
MQTQTAITKRRRRPKDKISSVVETATLEQKKELEETRMILDQIKRATETEDPEIDGLTAADVLRGQSAKGSRKRYYKLLAKGKIINAENADMQVEGNALGNIKRLKKESKEIGRILKAGGLSEKEVKSLEARMDRIPKEIEKEKTRAAELLRRLEN